MKSHILVVFVCALLSLKCSTGSTKNNVHHNELLNNSTSETEGSTKNNIHHNEPRNNSISETKVNPFDLLSEFDSPDNDIKDNYDIDMTFLDDLERSAVLRIISMKPQEQMTKLPFVVATNKQATDIRTEKGLTAEITPIVSDDFHYVTIEMIWNSFTENDGFTQKKNIIRIPDKGTWAIDVSWDMEEKKTVLLIKTSVIVDGAEVKVSIEPNLLILTESFVEELGIFAKWS